MDAAGKQLWKKSLIWGGGIIGMGYVLYAFTTPDADQLMAKMSPEVRAGVEKNRELRRQEQLRLMENVKKTAASNDPIWKTGIVQSPWDPDFQKTSRSLLVNQQELEKKKAEEKQKAELAELTKRVAAAEELEKTEKKKRWFW